MTAFTLFKKENKAKKEPAKKTADEKKTPASVTRNHELTVKSVLRRPILSEKATLINSLRQYVFLVDTEATKPAIKHEVERRYGVNVITVNTINKRGKLRHYGRISGRKPDLKKAIVTLKEGQK